MYIAFIKWFQKSYSSCMEEGAMFLAQMAFHSTSHSPVWEYLEKTGDKEYTKETFLKASKLILEEIV